MKQLITIFVLLTAVSCSAADWTKKTLRLTDPTSGSTETIEVIFQEKGTWKCDDHKSVLPADSGSWSDSVLNLVEFTSLEAKVGNDKKTVGLLVNCHIKKVKKGDSSGANSDDRSREWVVVSVE